MKVHPRTLHINSLKPKNNQYIGIGSKTKTIVSILWSRSYEWIIRANNQFVMYSSSPVLNHILKNHYSIHKSVFAQICDDSYDFSLKTPPCVVFVVRGLSTLFNISLQYSGFLRLIGQFMKIVKVHHRIGNLSSHYLIQLITEWVIWFKISRCMLKRSISSCNYTWNDNKSNSLASQRNIRYIRFQAYSLHTNTIDTSHLTPFATYRIMRLNSRCFFD